MENGRTTPWGKYISAFLITGVIFATAIITNNFFNEKRIEQLRSIEEGIAIDILSLETQFELLKEQSCKSIAENPILSRELDTLAKKLSFAEARLGADNEEVLRLKRHYSLLEIKDLILMQKVSAKCDELKPIFLLYFYSNEEGTCSDCEKQGYVLTELSRDYPQLRIYSFDYNLDLSAIETLISLKNISSELPALVIDNETYSGFKSTGEIQELLPTLLEE
ncbi:hypothetical protein COB52_03085 [Candidatus Kaiserbacteria bacterium]|nr:MAG: hypothetical protein COB52_03085 [Candidatus Kaiserbacteria bacterium]